MPAETTAAGVTPIDAMADPLVDTGLHECGHAWDRSGANSLLAQ
jgi:hypothetical protein